MKKLSMFQLTLLVTFGGLAIAGVLIFSIANRRLGGGDSNAVKIWGTLDQGTFAAVIRQSAETHPELSQVTYEQKDAATFESELTDALASGGGPDLFLLRQDYALKDAGKASLIPFSALSKAQFENTFIEAANPFLAQNGVIAVPIFADPLILYWNKDMLASAGYAQAPKYWDELFQIAQKVSKRDDSGAIVKSAIALGEYKNVTNAKDILATLILQAGGDITVYDNARRLIPALAPRAGAGSTQSTASAARFFTEFADPSKNQYSWNRSLPESQKAFAAGDVALYVGYASEAPFITRTNPNLNFGLAPVPQIRSASNSVNTAHVWGLAASRTGKNPNGAITVAFLLVSADTGSALSSALGIPSARRDILNKPAQGNDDLFNKQAILSHSWPDPDPEKTAEVFRAMIENTTSGALLVAEAVQRADQELAHILGL
ncbi:extracellular solute-binding protein [Candidatus Kaiserbacteria bacterium]|nr:extracellular solute-binding protein [Candidatus Kaiserbacteria bacterium]